VASGLDTRAWATARESIRFGEGKRESDPRSGARNRLTLYLNWRRQLGQGGGLARKRGGDDDFQEYRGVLHGVCSSRRSRPNGIFAPRWPGPRGRARDEGRLPSSTTIAEYMRVEFRGPGSGAREGRAIRLETSRRIVAGSRDRHGCRCFEVSGGGTSRHGAMEGGGPDSAGAAPAFAERQLTVPPRAGAEVVLGTH